MGHGPKRHCTFHVNGIMKWYAPTAAIFLTFDETPVRKLVKKRKIVISAHCQTVKKGTPETEEGVLRLH